MSDQLDKKAEKAAQKASRQAQKDRMKAARASEKHELKLDKQGEKSRRKSDKAAGRTVKPSTAQKVAMTGGRLIVGVSGVAATAVVLGGIALVPWPSWGVSAPVSEINPSAAIQQRVCPGPLLTVGANTAQANTISSLGPVSVVSTGGDASSLSTTNPNAGTDGAPQAFTAAADASPLAAAQSQNLALESYAGLTAAACTEPVTETWLVGGNSTLGNTGVLVISNPSDVAADVRIELFGAEGSIAAEGLGGILVDPGQQVEFPLAGFAPNEQRPVIHVVSAGGRISAALNVSQIAGLTPVGAEVVGPSALPATVTAIPGVVVDTSGASAESGDGADGLPTLRLLAPAGDTRVDISVLGENGIAGTVQTVDLVAGTVIDVPIAGLAPGSYSIVLASEQPIVAAAQSAVAAAEGVDFAWFASATALPDSAGVAIPATAAATMHLVNVSKVAITATLANGQQVSVPASGAVAVPASAGAGALSGVSGLFASVSLQAPGRLASFALPGVVLDSSAVSVYTR